jgi:LysM repeat protein
MSDTALSNLQSAVSAAAAAGTFALDATFLRKGLADPSVTVPAGYDGWVAKAFGVADAAAFKVTAQAGNVDPVKDGSFSVRQAGIPFLGKTLSSAATLRFSVSDASVLLVEVDTTPGSWSWTDSFPQAVGWPFTQLLVSGVSFGFSSAAASAQQSFSASLPLPGAAAPYLSLFDGLTAPKVALVFSGSLDFSEFDGDTVLFPTGSISATLQSGTFSLLYLQVSNPSLTLTFPPPGGEAEPDAGELWEEVDEEADKDQTPTLTISSGIAIGAPNPGEDSPYLLNVDVSPPASGTGVPATFGVGLTATGKGTPLTPASIAALVGGSGSYFTAAPAVLQQFLAAVALQGLSLAGQLGKVPSVRSVSVQIGSAPGTTWTPIPDPTGQLDFTITNFWLSWAVLNPFNPAARQQTFGFGTQFTLAPSVFKGPGGVGDGVFTVEFTSGLQFYASFAGTATLHDFLFALSGGAIALPPSVQAELSDVRLSLDYAAKSFSFSSGFALSLSFLEIDGKPVLSISDGTVRVAARTPTQKGDPKRLLASRRTAALVRAGADPEAASGTVWQAGIGGLLAVGPLSANASVEYDGFSTPPRWNMSASLAQPVEVQQLIKQFFDPGGTYDFPSFLPGSLELNTFAAAAMLPAGNGAGLAPTYSIDTTFRWNFQIAGQTVGINPAKLGVAYDGSKPKGQQLSGYAEGTWVWDEIGLRLLTGYKFVPSAQGGSKTLYVQWQGFRAEYRSPEQVVTFSLKGWSLGTLIQALVRTLGDPYFTLPSPWDLLNQVTLDGLSVAVSLKSNDPNRITASYKLSSPIDLGFMRINGLSFGRDTTVPNGRVTLALDATIAPVLLGSLPPEQKTKFENLANPAKGQDVRDLPQVPGRGESYFKLFLLVLGQRVSITGASTFNSTQEVICALQNVPSTTGKSNPVDPNANKGTTTGLPYYDKSSNWMIAAHFGVLQVAGVWTVDAQVVFNDPNLYGLRLTLGGAKAGGLAGLMVDILYKKITDDVGVFQIDFTFPDSVRNLNFGAVNVVLPQLGVKVYTNGDFFIDIGFPYNLDFRRSFSFSAIVYGVPVLGSGGLYFGKLSAATATQVPRTTQGTFDPVIVFGLGLQLGLGYDFTKGPLSAGFALTVFGIVEGVIAAWHPYVPAGGSKALQDDYYFKLSGTVGVIGLLYGKIDFAIIQASLNVKITLSIQITYESYKPIQLTAAATVDVSLKVKIDLGLFSISISLSFSARVSASFVIELPGQGTAPWADGGALHAARPVLHGPDAIRLAARALRPRAKRLVLAEGDTKGQLKVVMAPQFTVLAPEGSTGAAAQQGAFVFLLAMDAPQATGPRSTDPTSFETLCAAYFPWLVDLMEKDTGDTVRLADVAFVNVTRDQLDSWVHALADTAAPPLSTKDLLTFLGDAFTLDVHSPETARASGVADALDAGAMLFPVFDGLSLAVPDPTGAAGKKPIPFETYATATSAYRASVAGLFAEVEAAIGKQNQEKPRLRAQQDDPESLAALVFTDTFAMIGRQLLQAARDSLDAYAYPLAGGDSIQTILDWANGQGNALVPGDVALPNQDHDLGAGLALKIAGLTYTLQGGDTLSKVAARYTSAPRWATTESALIVANGAARVLVPGVAFTVQGKDGPLAYTTAPGDSFQSIAGAAGIALAELAQQTVLYGIDGLLAPARTLDIPTLAYTTAGTAGDASPDTLASVAAAFATTVAALADDNLTVAGLFSQKAEGGVVTLANLHALSAESLGRVAVTPDQVAQTAGMVSRFLMFGLRLPSGAGLAPSADFLYPAGQKGFGLYQLTGQQFPTPSGAAGYTVTLSRAARSHDVDLGWILFDGAPGTSADADLGDAYTRLSVVVDWARTGAFQPSPKYDALPLSARAAKTFAVRNFAYWQTSDVAQLLALTNRTVAAAATDGAQPQPLLWPLPAGLLTVTESRQEALERRMGGLKAALPLLPSFTPQVGTTSPATGETRYTPLSQWAWATRVDFQVKRIPAGSVIAAGGTGVDSDPSGPASAPSLPNVYEMLAPNSEDALRLQQVLSAMDVLGEGIASAVSVLYAPGGGGTPSLVTLGASEFLAFITQTNLSTETNPERAALLAAMAGAPPRGIANPPGEFVKLLWELSVVRGGGYYFYYQVAKSGDGLPASVFDTSGTATLSLVVTYAATGSLSWGESLPGFVNALVSTDPLDTTRDIVRVCSAAGSGTGAPLTGADDETLGSVAAAYGVGVGQIAEANPTAKLAEKVIPVAGIVRQLAQPDLANPGTALDTLASYYSAGAVTAITGAQIQAYNPGVPVALGSVFHIPPLSYKVSAGAAPGATFGSIGKYYGLSPDAVAVNARAVGGLFPAGTALTIDTTLLDLRSTLGPGNVGVRLERDNLGEPPVLPPNPTPEQKAAYARPFMYQLYNTLSAGIAANPFFSASPWGLPFGPQDHRDGETDGAHAFASHAARAETRRLRLAAAEDAHFDYRQQLGFGRFAGINAAPDLSGLPARADNPYAGVGTTAQVALRWQDVFGNTTITPFDAPPSGYTGALNGAPAPVLYSDLLVGVAGWPNVRTSYQYDASQLQVGFALDASGYDTDPDRAAHDLGVFRQVYYQLHQDYTGLGLPWVTGNAVTMVLRNSLLAQPDTVLAPAQADVVRGFVRDCVTYLQSRVSSRPAGDVPAATLALPVSPADVAAGSLIELDVALVFERNPLLTDPAVAALEEGLAVSSTILPRADDTQNTAYTGFANRFEALFKTAAWNMKVGEGLRSGSEAAAQRSQQLSAVRFGAAAGDGIHFGIGAAAGYYAPSPISGSLESQTVDVTDYVTGETAQRTFTGVDQNLWFQGVLDAVDAFLSAEFSSPAFILDRLLGTTDPLEDGYLGRVLGAKESLAGSISASVIPVLSTSAGDESTLWAAKEKMRQQLLNQLGAAYTAGTVIVFGLDGVSGAPDAAPGGPPSLYGQPTGGAAEGLNQNYSLTPARIPLGPTTVKANGQTHTYDPRLGFVFTSRNVPDQAYVPLQLVLQVTHLEFDRQTVPGIEGYVQSRWLQFVNGPFDYVLGADVSDIPVVNRMLPTPPTIQQQTAAQHSGEPSNAAELALWDYSFEYLYPQAAQDLVQTTLELNMSPGGLVRAMAAKPDLFRALAQFVTSYPAILADFNQYLRRIDGGDVPQATVDGAKKAVDAFTAALEAVAGAHAAEPRALLGSGALPREVRIDFASRLADGADDAPARSEIISILIDGEAATWTPGANPDGSDATISNGTVTLPALVVQISPAAYDAVPLASPPPNVVIAYEYVPREGTPGGNLSHGEAKAIPTRTVLLPRLDVLAYQSAWSSIFVQRNKLLFPVEDADKVSTTPAFLFQTPVVRFAEPIVPRLVYRSFALDGGGALEGRLNTFFESLFSGGDGTTSVEVSMSGGYSYQLIAGNAELPRISLPITLMPPTAAPVSSAAPPPFTAPFAAVVDEWRKTNHPTTDGDPQVNIGLQLFGGTSAKQPLITIADLHAAVDGE